MNPALSDFETGTAYTVTAPGGEFVLKLANTEELSASPRPQGAFRLEFRGPYEPILEQAIYPFRAGDFACDIFIVPIARDDAGTTYEAIFY